MRPDADWNEARCRLGMRPDADWNEAKLNT